MARMIPDLCPQDIENDGERAFYIAAKSLPGEYVVCYSFKYRLPSKTFDRPETGSLTSAGTPPGQDHYTEVAVREADLVIAHPALGYVTVEVKQGHVMYNNVWYELKSGTPAGPVSTPLAKDPADQALKAMHAVKDLYRERTCRAFPLRYQYAICFPECSRVSGQLPAQIREENIILSGDLDNLDAAVRRMFPAARSGHAPGWRAQRPGQPLTETERTSARLSTTSSVKCSLRVSKFTSGLKTASPASKNMPASQSSGSKSTTLGFSSRSVHRARMPPRRRTSKPSGDRVATMVHIRQPENEPRVTAHVLRNFRDVSCAGSVTTGRTFT